MFRSDLLLLFVTVKIRKLKRVQHHWLSNTKLSQNFRTAIILEIEEMVNACLLARQRK